VVMRKTTELRRFGEKSASGSRSDTHVPPRHPLQSWGLGFGVWGLGFGVWGLRVWGLGFWGWGLGVQDLGFRV